MSRNTFINLFFSAFYCSTALLSSCHPLRPSGDPAASPPPSANPNLTEDGSKNDGPTEQPSENFIPLNEIIGRYKGYSQINSVLHRRLIKDDTTF